MAIFEDALYRYLVALDVAGARVYPQRLKQNEAYPQLSFFKVTGRGSPQVLSGGASSWQTALFQIDVWSQSYQEAKEIVETLRLALDGLVTVMTGWRVAVSGFVSRDQYHDDLQPPAVHQVICECTIQFGDYQG